MTEILLTETFSLNSIKTHVRSCEWQIFYISYQALFPLIEIIVIVHFNPLPAMKKCI